MPEPSEMSGPEVAKTPGGRAPGKEGMEAVANGHAGEGEQGGDDPFAEYMWMENEDAYNRQVEEELLEQEFLERCFQEMLDEEDQDWFIPARDLPSGMGQLQQQLNGLSVNDRGNAEEMAVLRSAQTRLTQSTSPRCVEFPCSVIKCYLSFISCLYWSLLLKYVKQCFCLMLFVKSCIAVYIA
ncbi:polyadenylate-binding protein-interacting protein 2B-like isoform X3 [Oncorhynchus keta]|uniref:polyadenylate-binding protein-interacting protein 2B-like isoform X3 n=1 Tax=Oncorhynchus keta TaxID=8018 RepID=UPI0015FB8943|nr:polyadenylate-binding protein-interacting protein 2B-like isoform X3 [Oncorhynchus keta]